MVFKKKSYDLLEEPQDDLSTEDLEEIEQENQSPLVVKRGRPVLRPNYRDEEDLEEEEEEEEEEEPQQRTPPRKKPIIRYEAVHSPEITGIRDNETGQILMEVNILTSILNKLDEIDKKL